jgi:hypothetical protein
MLSDIFPTGFHATELAGVQAGDSVVVYSDAPSPYISAVSMRIMPASMPKRRASSSPARRSEHAAGRKLHFRQVQGKEELSNGMRECLFNIRPVEKMKKLIFALALLIGSSAHAQVYFDSGSARPNNPAAAKRAVEHQRAQHVVKARPKLVRCRDGARRQARLCGRHGGVARR